MDYAEQEDTSISRCDDATRRDATRRMFRCRLDDRSNPPLCFSNSLIPLIARYTLASRNVFAKHSSIRLERAANETVRRTTLFLNARPIHHWQWNESTLVAPPAIERWLFTDIFLSPRTLRKWLANVQKKMICSSLRKNFVGGKASRLYDLWFIAVPSLHALIRAILQIVSINKSLFTFHFVFFMGTHYRSRYIHTRSFCF